MTSSVCNTILLGHNKVELTGCQTDGAGEKEPPSMQKPRKIHNNSLGTCEHSAECCDPASREGLLCDLNTGSTGQSRDVQSEACCKEGIEAHRDKTAIKEQDAGCSIGAWVEFGPGGSCENFPEMEGDFKDLHATDELNFCAGEIELLDSCIGGARKPFDPSGWDGHEERSSGIIGSLLDCSNDVLDRNLKQETRAWVNLQYCGDVCSRDMHQVIGSTAASQPTSVGGTFDSDSVGCCSEMPPDSCGRKEKNSCGEEDAYDKKIGSDNTTGCRSLDSSDRTVLMRTSRCDREVSCNGGILSLKQGTCSGLLSQDMIYDGFNSNVIKPEGGSSCIQADEVRSGVICNRAREQDSNICDMYSKNCHRQNTKALEAEEKDKGIQESESVEDCHGQADFQVRHSASNMGAIEPDSWRGSGEKETASKELSSEFQSDCRSKGADLELNHHGCLEDMSSDGHESWLREQHCSSGYTGVSPEERLVESDSAAMSAAASLIPPGVLPSPLQLELVALDTEQIHSTGRIGYYYTHLITPETQQDLSRTASPVQISEGGVQVLFPDRESGKACTALGMSELLEKPEKSLHTSSFLPLLASALPRAEPAAASSPASPSASSLDPPDTDGTTSDIGSSRGGQEEGGPRHWLLGSGGNSAGGAEAVNQSPAGKGLGDGRSPLNTLSRSFWEGMAASIEISPYAATASTKHNRGMVRH